ncbi:hypothetical protein [Streptomyces sp. NPDC058086]|uniref:hypothetical protein n=1 Tax=Streptomyces sp. NPDC058086 TaxID=3346334 RepID=UPI0036EE34EB
MLYKFDLKSGETGQELKGRLKAVAGQFDGKLDPAVIHNLDDGSEQETKRGVERPARAEARGRHRQGGRRQRPAPTRPAARRVVEEQPNNDSSKPSGGTLDAAGASRTSNPASANSSDSSRAATSPFSATSRT